MNNTYLFRFQLREKKYSFHSIKLFNNKYNLSKVQSIYIKMLHI